jgi:hypothetical protein
MRIYMTRFERTPNGWRTVIFHYIVRYLLTADRAYDAFSALLWRRVELWKLGTIERASWPED